jgi:hypothetical protein
VVDQEPLLFRDPVAADLIGEPGAEMVGYHRRSGDHIVLAGTRAQVTVRSRYTETRLGTLADDGLTQYVLLGAGLDTFAYRSPLAGRLRTFEVDHPATQRWKRDLLAAAGMYLTADAVAATLAAVGGLAAGTELVMEYALPPELRDERGQAHGGFALPVAAERGEPWLSCFTPRAAVRPAGGERPGRRRPGPPAGRGPARPLGPLRRPAPRPTCAGWPGPPSRPSRPGTLDSPGVIGGRRERRWVGSPPGRCRSGPGCWWPRWCSSRWWWRPSAVSGRR